MQRAFFQLLGKSKIGTSHECLYPLQRYLYTCMNETIINEKGQEFEKEQRRIYGEVKGGENDITILWSQKTKGA